MLRFLFGFSSGFVRVWFGAVVPLVNNFFGSFFQKYTLFRTNPQYICTLYQQYSEQLNTFPLHKKIKNKKKESKNVLT